MKNGKDLSFSPILFGIVGGLASTAAAFLGALLTAAAFMNTADPNSYVLISACVSVLLGGMAGGILSVKLGGAYISAVASAITSLLIMAAVSMFLPESEGVLSRILPPLTLTASTLIFGYVSLGRKQTKADTVKKAVKKARK